MNSPATRSSFAALALMLLSGCSLFSQTVEPAERQRVLDQIHVGMPMDTVEGKILSLGYECGGGHGSFIDENGQEREAARFLSCVQRPGMIGFACLNRDQVYVIPSAGVADEIHVTRGPSCLKQ